MCTIFSHNFLWGFSFRFWMCCVFQRLLNVLLFNSRIYYAVFGFSETLQLFITEKYVKTNYHIQHNSPRSIVLFDFDSISLFFRTIYTNYIFFFFHTPFLHNKSWGFFFPHKRFHWTWAFCLIKYCFYFSHSMNLIFLKISVLIPFQ